MFSTNSFTATEPGKRKKRVDNDVVIAPDGRMVFSDDKDDDAQSESSGRTAMSKKVRRLIVKFC